MQIKKPHQKDLRVGRFSKENHIYHITTTTLNRTPIFKSLVNARLMINILKKSDSLSQTQTLALVVMPDHLHWLFQLNNKLSLPKLLQSIKSVSSHTIGKPIWQPGYYDHAIRKDEDIVNIARYIIANPIRAGLVKRVGDYPHWDTIYL